jgi:hypothetical protein
MFRVVFKANMTRALVENLVAAGAYTRSLFSST